MLAAITRKTQVMGGAVERGKYVAMVIMARIVDIAR